ncbi:MAG: pilus assembly protein [Planctomycetaceae bacterium]|nr:pilus assembly protein [Planctomycetaceae bacterium]
MKRHRKGSFSRDPGCRPQHAERRGATIVEFAIVAPVFFMLLFAGIEFALLSQIRSTAHNAAYEAARMLVIPGADAAAGITEAERIMAIVGVDTLTVTVTPGTITDDTHEVTVNVSVPYASNAVFTPFFTGSVVLNSSVTLATERYSGIVAGP